MSRRREEPRAMGWMQDVYLTPEEDAALDEACEQMAAQAQAARQQRQRWPHVYIPTHREEQRAMDQTQHGPHWTPEADGAGAGALDLRGCEMTALWPRTIQGRGVPEEWKQRHQQPTTCYVTTDHDRLIDPEAYADVEDWGGADEHEMTLEEWAEAAERQAAEVAEDPEYAKWLDILRNSPAMRPWSPPLPDDEDEDDDEDDEDA
jgi:hypothetical protein